MQTYDLFLNTVARLLLTDNTTLRITHDRIQHLKRFRRAHQSCLGSHIIRSFYEVKDWTHSQSLAGRVRVFLSGCPFLDISRWKTKIKWNPLRKARKSPRSDWKYGNTMANLLFRSLDQEMNFANTNGQTRVNLINVSLRYQSHFRYNEIHVS